MSEATSAVIIVFPVPAGYPPPAGDTTFLLRQAIERQRTKVGALTPTGSVALLSEDRKAQLREALRVLGLLHRGMPG